MLKTPLFTRFQPKKSDENLPKPQKYFFKFFFVLKPKNWRKQIWSRIEFYNMWYVYLTFEVSWTEKSQNIEFPDFPLFLIFAQRSLQSNSSSEQGDQRMSWVPGTKLPAVNWGQHGHWWHQALHLPSPARRATCQAQTRPSSWWTPQRRLELRALYSAPLSPSL